jgi:hypothetical protein
MAKPVCTGQWKKIIPGKQKICLCCIKAAHSRLVEEKQYFHIVLFYFILAETRD